MASAMKAPKCSGLAALRGERRCWSARDGDGELADCRGPDQAVVVVWVRCDPVEDETGVLGFEQQDRTVHGIGERAGKREKAAVAGGREVGEVRGAVSLAAPLHIGHVRVREHERGHAISLPGVAWAT